METIVGLLFILLPVIFKLIEKKLQQSGTAAQQETVRQIKDLFEMEENDLTDEIEDDVEPEIGDYVEPEPKFVVNPVIEFLEKVEPQVVKPAAPAQKKRTAPILMEEKDNKKKEKIDPKKLVLYSEIMKPKHQE
jgi:hypothetical protein